MVEAGVNGVAGIDELPAGWLRGAKRGKRPLSAGHKALRAKAARKGPRGALRGGKRLAVAVGAVATGVLGLSVHHCTESIGLLTGSHWALAGLLAIGIDAGMVVAEMAWMQLRGREGQNWAQGYVVASVLLSMLLNAYAFGLHAAEGMLWAAWLLGAVIPGLVYCLGRVAGGLWLSE